MNEDEKKFWFEHGYNAGQEAVKEKLRELLGIDKLIDRKLDDHVDRFHSDWD